MTYADKEIVCAECGTTFIFSSGEQEFYAGRGLLHEPRRCPQCRASRKEGRQGGYDRPRELYPAVCARCGIDTQVPFRPTGVRPVYCGECYSVIRS